MLDPASAVGLAASIVQLTTFVTGILNDSHELYQSMDGTLIRNLELETVCTRLDKIVKDIKDRQKAGQGRSDKPIRNLNQADALLMELSNESQVIINDLSSRLRSLRLPSGASRWRSIRQAVQCVLESHQLERLENRLRRNQNEVNTALLLALHGGVQDLLAEQEEKAEKAKEDLRDDSVRQKLRKRRREAQQSGFNRHEFAAISYSDSDESDREYSIKSESPSSLLYKALCDYREFLPDDQPASTSATNTVTSTIPNTFASTLLTSVANRDNSALEDSYRHQIIACLSFNKMPDREEAIPKAYLATFQWMFEDSNDSGDSLCPAQDYNNGKTDVRDPITTLLHPIGQNFSSWLRSKESVYWISGKPGAGKSTLIKLLQQDDRTKELARKHALHIDQDIQETLSVAAFFFWISGSRIQRSKEGLLRTLLHQLLRECPELVEPTFPIHMQRSRLLGTDPLAFNYAELLEGLERLLCVRNRSFLLFIDGLDEFGGDCADIIGLVRRISAKPSVKICVASRPWPIFEDAFGGNFMLQLESLTRKDILAYIHGKFGGSRQFQELLTFQRQEAEELISDLADKASGVFLWIYLAVESLLEGVRDGDDVRDLKKRLYDLPGELEDLFDRILQSIDPSYAIQASELFQFHRAFPEETNLISLHLSQIPLEEALKIEAKPYTDAETQYFANKMRSKLYSRCKCFLEVKTPCGPTSSVTYLHRTAKDFLEQPIVWKNVTAKAPDYNAARAVSISRLMHTKVMPLNHPWRDVAELCQLLIFDSALEQVSNHGHRKMFIDAVEWLGDTYYNKEFSYWVDNLFLDTTLLSDTLARVNEIRDMFDLMLAADFDWYVALKLETEPSLLARQIHGRHALAFAVEQNLWRSQKVLLENGADPNHDDGEGSAWRLLLTRTLIEMRSVLPNATRERLFRALPMYLNHGADPNAITFYTTGIKEDVKVSGVIHIALASMSNERYSPDCRHLEASFNAASDGAKKGKRKRYLGL